ncbi:MAG: hypothetical protein Q7R56_00355 [Nanoarchaeota archaeon]|nr:hypothetical protein [Nanoarchaeota archaeon]
MKCWCHKKDGSLCENEGSLTTANGFPVCPECKGNIREYVDPKHVVAIPQSGNAHLKGDKK